MITNIPYYYVAPTGKACYDEGKTASLGERMHYNTQLIAGKLQRWEGYLTRFELPTWDELPPLDLYMDQVVALLGKYLDFLPADEKQGSVVTPTAINNYVRMRIMPPPKKKKYARVHIAYLIMICSLKQSMSISYVQKMIPMGLDEEEVKSIYNAYVAQHKHVCTYFIEEVRQAAIRLNVLDPANENENAVRNFVTSCAVISGLNKLLAEKIVKLQNVDHLPESQMEPLPKI